MLVSVIMKDDKIEFSDITSPEKLCEFLRCKGSNHKAYFQYTDMTALNGILKNRTIWLTRADKLNDLAECNGMNSTEKQKTYIASFTFGSMESVAMWFLYPRDHKAAVRVKFSQKIMNALQKLLTSTYRAYSTKEDDPTEYLIEEFYFTDIIYAHNGSLEYNMQKLLNSNKDKEKEQEGTVELLKKSDELKGLIKTAPWAYEKEVRLIVKLAQTEDTPEKIAVKFPDNAQGISVTLGPVNSYIKLLEVECGKSSLTNQISNEFTARFI